MPPPPLPGRRKRATIVAWWEHLAGVWKTLMVLAAAVGFGAGAVVYVQKYVTRADLVALQAAVDLDAKLVAKVETDTSSKLGELERALAAQTAELQAVQKEAQETRDNVRLLLQRMLEIPPPRSSP